MTLVRRWAFVALSLLFMFTPRFAQAAPPPLEAYGKLPGVEFMRLSPSGQRYAFIRSSGAARQLVIMPVDGDAPTIVPFAENDKLRGLEWAGDEHLVVWLSGTAHGPNVSVDNFEIFQTLIVPLNGAKSFYVSDNGGRYMPYISGYCGSAVVDGHWYGYFGGSQGSIFRVNLNTGQANRLVAGGVGRGGCALDADGRIVARGDYYQKTGAWWIRSESIDKAILSGHSLTEGPLLMGLGLTPDAVIVYNPDADVRAFEVLPLSGGPPQLIGDREAISRPLHDPLTKLWIGNVTQGEQHQYSFFSPERQSKFDAARRAFSKYNVVLVSWVVDFNRFILFTDSGDDSGTFWLVDTLKHSAESIGQAYPGVKEVDVGAAKMVGWKAADGLELRGVLTLPPHRSPHGLPVVVLPHGGPNLRDVAIFDWLAQAFASRGYAVFQPNFRGSAGYGLALEKAGYGEWGRKMQTDISDGLAALAAEGVVDPRRACIVGSGFGGYAALAGVTIQHGLYRCAVSHAGDTDLRQMLKYEDSLAGDAQTVRARSWANSVGVDSIADETLDIRSPAKLADHADAPILLIHGKDDSVVPITQSLEMQAALKRAGKPVEMVVMPNEDHWLSRADTRLSMLTAAVAFVQKYNPAN